MFGPVDLTTLKSWACDGRLSPTNEISADGTEWKLATSFRELEMDWVAEVTPGTFYGPIHRRAMEDLIKDGSIAAAGSFFLRRGLSEGSGGKAAAKPNDEETGRLSRAADDAHRRAAACEEDARLARESAASSASQVEQLRRQLTEQAEQAQRQVAAYEEQVRLAQQQLAGCAAQEETSRRQLADQMEQAQRLVAASEERLRQAQQQLTVRAEQEEKARAQHADQMEQALRQIADYEEQMRQAHVQVTAYASEADHARQQTVLAEQRLREAEEKVSVKTGQALLSQEALVEKAERFAREVTDLRREQAVSLAKASDQKTALEVRVSNLEARLSEATLGRQEAQTALKQLQLEAAKTRGESESFLADIGEELKLVRRQVETLSTQLHRGDKPLAEKPAATEHIVAEPVDAEVLPPERPKGGGGNETQSGRGAASDRQRKPVEAPPVSNQAHTLSGLSMADLEQQARRELERLGAQGANLFKKKR